VLRFVDVQKQKPDRIPPC